jgi:hypothetical protein
MRYVKLFFLVLALTALAGCTTVCSNLSGEAKTLCEALQKPAEPTTTEPTTTVPADEIVVEAWDDTDASAWPITAGLSNVNLEADGTVTATITGTDQWEVRADGGEKPSVGNWWVIAKCADGKYHAATYEWLKPGATKTVAREWAGADAVHGCIGTESLRPEAIMVSTVGRAAPWTGKERSPVVKVSAP